MNIIHWALLLALVPSAANAQTTKQTAAATRLQDPAPASAEAVPPDPQSTSAAYGDWVHICQRTGEPPQKICEVSQSVQLQGQPGPIAQLALGKGGTAGGLQLTLLLPPNILLSATPRVMADDKDTQPVEVPWSRCLPGGCFAEAPLKDDVVKRWRSLAGRGQITFKDGFGREVLLPVSFKGLARSLDAMAKE